MATAAAEKTSGFHWGAILGGSFVALGAWITLYALGAAIGISGTRGPPTAWTSIYVLVVPIIALFIGIGGEVVQHLWNWLLPELFGWRQITFWQALGLLALCRILFGGFGGHGGHRFSSRRRMGEHWEKLTPEEREKFRQGMRSRCGNFGAPTTSGNAV